MKKFVLALLLSTPGVAFCQHFSDQTSAVGMDHFCADSNQMAGGVAVFDMNNDGYDDFYLTGGTNRDHLYLNNQDGTFEEIGISAGLEATKDIYTTGVVTGDINNDGLRDVFVTTGRYEHNILYLNNGNNSFTDISVSAGLTHETWSMQAVMADYDNDGDLDIYVVNYVEYSVHPFYLNDTAAIRNQFYINNGNNTFTENAAGLGIDDPGSGLVAMFSDYDQDGDQDLIVGNDFHAIFGQPSQLYLNNYPMNSFYAVGGPTDFLVIGSIMGIAAGDPDNDLDFDYHMTNMQRNWYFENENDGTMRKDSTTYATPGDSLTGWGNAYFDYDNDMDEDFYFTNGQVLNVMSVDQANVFMINDGTGNWTDVSSSSGADNIREHRGLGISDFDHDGDIDMITVFTPNIANGYSGPEKSVYYQNEYSGSNNWIDVRLKGTVSNRDGIGALIRVVTGGISQVRELHAGSSYLSQNTAALHIGIGTANSVDSVIINWPSGAQDIHLGPNINETTYYIEGYSTCSGTMITNYNSIICEGDSVFLAGAYRKVTGVYQEVQVSSNTCDNLLQFNLTVLPTPSTTIGGSTIICDGDSTTLNASGANDFYWIGGDTTSSIVVKPTSTTDYILTGTTDGCSSNDTLTLVVAPIPSLVTSNDTMICKGETINLMVSGAMVYDWNNGMSSDSVFTISIANDSMNVVMGTSSQGCVSYDTVMIMMDTNNIVSNFTDSNMIDQVQTLFTADVQNATSFTWTVNGFVVGSNDTYTYDWIDFDSHEFCLIAENNCFSDTSCQNLVSPYVGMDELKPGSLLSVFPNPTNSVLHILWKNPFPKNNKYVVSVFNTLGETVAEQTLIPSENVALDVSAYSAGIYLLQVRLAGTSSPEYADQVRFVVK